MPFQQASQTSELIDESMAESMDLQQDGVIFKWNGGLRRLLKTITTCNTMRSLAIAVSVGDYDKYSIHNLHGSLHCSRILVSLICKPSSSGRS